MIAYIKGRVVVARDSFVVVDTGSLGYKVHIPTSKSFSADSEIILYTYHHLRENAEELYGFAAFEELELFEKLISVNGIGPKAAMQILSVSDSRRIIEAITGDDLTFFTAIPGIGKKAAAKIILDLKKKVSGIDSAGIFAGYEDANDVVDSLVALGYKKFEVSKALSKMPGGVESVEDKVRWCLKNMAK